MHTVNEANKVNGVDHATTLLARYLVDAHTREV